MPTVVNLLLMDGTGTATVRPISPSQPTASGTTTEVISLTATDADEGDNGTITYSLHTGLSSNVICVFATQVLLFSLMLFSL